MTTLCEQINEQKLDGKRPLSPAIVYYPEEYRCPACDSLIPSTMLKRTEETHAHGESLTRRVQIYCGHCNAAFEARFAIRNGLLAQLDSVTRVDLDGVRKLKEEFGVVSGDLSVTAHQQLASHFAKLEKDRALLKDRIAATEAQLACLRAADRAMARQPATRPPATALADSLPGWEPSGSLDQESCVRRFDASTSQISGLRGSSVDEAAARFKPSESSSSVNAALRAAADAFGGGGEEVEI